MKKLLVVLLVLLSVLFADKSDTLKKELIDIDGWKAEEAEGISMEMGGMKMTNAVREYSKGDQEFYATIMVGTNSMMQGQMPQADVETEDEKLQIKEINGFKVYQMFDKNENTGAIIVYLEQNETEGGFILFSYENLSPEIALKLTENFDWKKINKATESILKK